MFSDLRTKLSECSLLANIFLLTFVYDHLPFFHHTHTCICPRKIYVCVCACACLHLLICISVYAFNEYVLYLVLTY